MHLRDSAGSFEFADGTGEIKALCSFGDFVELYKIDATGRFESPDSFDPSRTDPTVPWVVSKIAEVGSGHEIVARVFLHGYELMKQCQPRDVDSLAVNLLLRSCKTALLSCESIFRKIAREVDEIGQKIEAGDLVMKGNARAINLPQVQNLEDDCGSFLIHANRSIRHICQLPSHFLTLDRVDSNFDHLANRLKNNLGIDSTLTKFVVENAEFVRQIADLRNFQEHPGNRITQILNFRVVPLVGINRPSWHVSDLPPEDIVSTMHGIIGGLIELVEMMMIHLVLDSVKQETRLIYRVRQLIEPDFDPTNAVRFVCEVFLNPELQSPEAAS